MAGENQQGGEQTGGAAPAPTAAPATQGGYGPMGPADVFDEPPAFAIPTDPPAAAPAPDANAKPEGQQQPPAAPAAPAAPQQQGQPPIPDAEISGYIGDTPTGTNAQRQQQAGGDNAGQAQPETQGQPKGGKRRQAKQDRFDAAISGAAEAQSEVASERRRRLASEAENRRLRQELDQARQPGTQPAAGVAPGTGAQPPAGAPAADTQPAAGSAAAQLKALKKPDFDEHDDTESYGKALDEYWAEHHRLQAAVTAEAAQASRRDTDQRDAARQAASADEAQWAENYGVMKAADDFEAVGKALAPLESPWANQQEFGQVRAPALDHFIRVNPKGGEVGLWLGRNAEKAKVLAELPGHPNQHRAHFIAWNRMARAFNDPIPVLDYMASEKGAKWFNDLGQLTTVDELIDSLAELRGRLAAVSVIREEDEHGGGPAPTVVSQAPPPGTPPQGTSTGGLQSDVHRYGGSTTDPKGISADFDKVFSSRWSKRFRDSQAVGAPAGGQVVVPQHAQLGL